MNSTKVDGVDYVLYALLVVDPAYVPKATWWLMQE
jgi:hypothetical protein